MNVRRTDVPTLIRTLIVLIHVDLSQLVLTMQLVVYRLIHCAIGDADDVVLFVVTNVTNLKLYHSSLLF